MLGDIVERAPLNPIIPLNNNCTTTIVGHQSRHQVHSDHDVCRNIVGPDFSGHSFNVDSPPIILICAYAHDHRGFVSSPLGLAPVRHRFFCFLAGLIIVACRSSCLCPLH